MPHYAKHLYLLPQTGPLKPTAATPHHADNPGHQSGKDLEGRTNCDPDSARYFHVHHNDDHFEFVENAILLPIYSHSNIPTPVPVLAARNRETHCLEPGDRLYLPFGF